MVRRGGSYCPRALAAMRRVQFIELHEQPWLPSSLRHGITDVLQFGLNAFRAYAPIAPLLKGALRSSLSESIVDMCSGGGGPWFDLYPRLQKGGHHSFQVVLTDKYPNLRAFQHAGVASENHIGFYPDSVDAANVPPELKGFRTMFTSLHHFPPVEARAVLQNAVDASQGIGIFEVTRRAPANDRVDVSLGAHAICAHAVGSSVPLFTDAVDLCASGNSDGAAVRWSGFLFAYVPSGGIAGDR